VPDGAACVIAELRLASRLLWSSSTQRRRKETSVTDKKMFKIMCAIPKKDGGTYWMRLGNGFENRDNSINMYLNALPAPNLKSGQYELQLRELDAEDLRRRESYATSSTPLSRAVTAATAGDAVPF